MGCGSTPEEEAGSGDKPRAAPPAPASTPPPAPAPPAEPPAEAAATDKSTQPKVSLEPPPDLPAPPADAQKTKSGIASRVLTAGKDGQRPRGDDMVWLEYTAWGPDGAIVDSSVKRGRPRQTKVHKLTSGWQEVVEQMTKGELRRAWIPEKHAYTDNERRAGRKGQLVMDILLSEHYPAPEAPADVKAPPKDAKLTASGLAFTVLTPPKNDRKPGPSSNVEVKYAGWTTDGRCFDFTGGDETMSFGVQGVIAGWTEGLQLMAEGQKNRFWIPEKLAYAGKEGKPQGMLVFDVELISSGN
jgi:peptidylprolyl isomerase